MLIPKVQDLLSRCQLSRLLHAAVYYLIASVFALFGVIHSPLRNEMIDLPSRVLSQIPETFQEVIPYQTPYLWAGAYGLIVLLLLGLALTSSNLREAKAGSTAEAKG